jgi:hypothetical protein
MRKLEEYKQNAKQCRALAALATRPEDKVTLEEIAEEWEKVAALRERDLHEADENRVHSTSLINGVR